MSRASRELAGAQFATIASWPASRSSRRGDATSSHDAVRFVVGTPASGVGVVVGVVGVVVVVVARRVSRSPLAIEAAGDRVASTRATGIIYVASRVRRHGATASE
jgi:hypothetical protein